MQQRRPSIIKNKKILRLQITNVGDDGVKGTLLHCWWECKLVQPLWTLGFPGGSVVKNLPANVEVMGRFSWIGKIPWRRKWQPTPVFLPGKFHGQRNLVCYSPWDHKESDMTECTHTDTHTYTFTEAWAEKLCALLLWTVYKDSNAKELDKVINHCSLAQIYHLYFTVRELE